MNTQTTKIAITFPIKLASRLRDKAEFEYGFDLPEMVRKLAANYVDQDIEPFSYITSKQEAAYVADIQRTKLLLVKGKIKAARSTKELRQQTEAEIVA